MSDETRIRQKFEELLDQLLYLTLLYSTSFELLKNNYLNWKFQQNKLIVPSSRFFVPSDRLTFLFFDLQYLKKH